MFKNILAIDFETANMSRSSACAVGAVKYALSGERIADYYSLIDPQDYFDDFNVLIHGITQEMVKGSPTFPAAIQPVFSLLDPETLVICHNTAFDISVIKADAMWYGVSVPDFTYACTYRLAKQLIHSSVSYTLPDVSAALSLPDFEHHDALQDAVACAMIFLSLVGRYDNDVDLLMQSANLNYGQVTDGEYTGIHKAHREPTGKHLKKAKIDIQAIQPDESSPFYGKTVCFTGQLGSMTRFEAIEIINHLGGNGVENLNRKTNYLITGYQDPKKLNGKEKSGKYLQAEKMMNKGIDIEIIPEEDFLKLI